MILWTARATGIEMCQIVAWFDAKLMSESGYTQTSRMCQKQVRSTLSSGSGRHPRQTGSFDPKPTFTDCPRNSSLSSVSDTMSY